MRSTVKRRNGTIWSIVKTKIVNINWHQDNPDVELAGKDFKAAIQIYLDKWNCKALSVADLLHKNTKGSSLGRREMIADGDSNLSKL